MVFVRWVHGHNPLHSRAKQSAYTTKQRAEGTPGISGWNRLFQALIHGLTTEQKASEGVRSDILLPLLSVSSSTASTSGIRVRIPS